MSYNTEEQMDNICKNMENLHYPAGPIYTNLHKSRAMLCMEKNEIEAIYSLVESHTPNLRFTAATRYEKALEPLSKDLSLNKNNFNFKCTTISTDNKIEHMLRQIREMPEEWIIIQLTSMYNKKESLELDKTKLYTNSLHVTVFNCGEDTLPFTITVEPPIDKINGKVIEIRQEMNAIITGDKKNCDTILSGNRTQAKVLAYTKMRSLLNNRLKDLVHQIETKWLAEWRCLLIGKFIDIGNEIMIASKIEEVLENEEGIDNLEKNKSLLKCLIRGAYYLNTLEIKNALCYMFPKQEHKNLRILLSKMIRDDFNGYKFKDQMRHPIILIVDEKLDFLPWEMMSILEDHPVTRMPCLHFTYALFKEHENTILDGWIINSSYGNYIINPSLDLTRMQIRLSAFFNYWLPKWSGIIGVQPTANDFQNILSNSDIFVYSGHGDGTQFLSADHIQRMRVHAVVLLFGCESVKLRSIGPQVEMYSSYQMYLIACSPCILGMLWAVTDIDTDAITTEFLSLLLRSKASKHWSLVDKQKWVTDGTLSFTKKKATVKECDMYEPEALRALCKAKKAASSYLVRAACVARGLPVKITQL